jgi:hypothetical protein
MSSPIILIAGPLQYWEGNYRSFDMAWDFIGEDRNQKLHRWRLSYKAAKRKFSVKQIPSDSGDQAHASTIRRLYEHVAIPRCDLPAGNTEVILKAMLPAKEVAFATSLSILGRRHG